MEIRKITKEEFRSAEKLHQYAYGYWSDQEIKDEDLEFLASHNPFGLFEDGKLKSILTLLKVQQSIRGVMKGMGGISMVGTYPEARAKGYVRALMQTAFLEMKESGLSLSMLEPFRETFYARLGYVSASPKLRLEAPFDGLRIPPKNILEAGWEFERVPGVDAKETYLNFIQDFAPPRYNGFAINPEITDGEWKRRNKNRLFVFVKRRGIIEALARYRIKGFMHFKEKGEFIVNEMYWESLDAQAALFHFFGKHKDQIKKIKMELPYQTDFHHWFLDLMENIEIKTWNPWMVRIIDIKEAITGLPVPGPGELTVKVTDPQCTWNNGTFTIQSSGDLLEIASSKRAPSVEASIEGISALIYGTHSLEALEFYGWLKVSNKYGKQILSEWFPQLPLYNPYSY